MDFAIIIIALDLLIISRAESAFVSDHVNLESDYSKDSLPPTEGDTPLLLRASVNLRNILDVFETKQQIRQIDLYMI